MAVTTGLKQTPLMIKLALEQEDGNHRGLSLSVSEAPSPRKLRNDSPGIMPAASRLVCVCVCVAPGFHFLSASATPPHRLPVPLCGPSQTSEMSTKSKGLGILASKRSFIKTNMHPNMHLHKVSFLPLAWAFDVARMWPVTPRADKFRGCFAWLGGFLPGWQAPRTQ